VDVRKPEEIEKGIIANAVNIDFTDSSFEEKVSALDRKKPYFVYCKSGKRSTAAVEQMGKLGFETIYVLEGGLDRWQEDGHEVVIP
jgi:rhodanese-related sulfurtransferase